MTANRRLAALYICYLSLEDPLVHTQVVSYLGGLAAAGHRIHLLTFETRRLTRARRREVRARLAQQKIIWHGRRYHKRPSLPATVYDVLAGAITACLLVLRHRINTLHARSHVPAAMALIARRLVWRQTALIFDIRGLMAEEYEDAGRWRRGGIPFQLTKAVERAAIRHADGIVVLTDRVARQLFGERGDYRVHVIPCCADLEQLNPARTLGAIRRHELGLDDRRVMVYVGKFGGWYMTAEMASFFVTARAAIPDLHFLILSQEDTAQIASELGRAGARPEDYVITRAPSNQVGEYLAAADFGISLIRPSPSKASSSPTKIGEYLAAGLPVVCTAGVGDLDALIEPEIGVLIREHSPTAYAAAAAHISQLLARTETRASCRAVAQRTLSLAEVGIPRYCSLYEQVLTSPACARKAQASAASRGRRREPRRRTDVR